MSALVTLTASRQAKESAHANEAELLERHWRRAWIHVFAQCLGLALLGYLSYGISWGLTGSGAVLLAATGFLVGYVLPFFRLLAFFLRNADQF
ncbi:MAG TPA: hypothetical protein VGQ69_11770 [Gemmatimonadales bacterium]|jgi:hypothetical protein|nr:hypothetical protein [Gemmatimonadales bacterium]